jgi:hypothetical protein
VRAEPDAPREPRQTTAKNFTSRVELTDDRGLMTESKFGISARGRSAEMYRVLARSKALAAESIEAVRKMVKSLGLTASSDEDD